MRTIDHKVLGSYLIQKRVAPQGLCIEIKHDHIWKNYIKPG